MSSGIYLESGATRVDLAPGATLGVGRLPENEVLLTSARASRRHARVQMTGALVRVIDLHSGSGTRVNGALLAPDEWFELRIGDRIEFADELFVLRADGVPLDATPWELTIVRSPERE